MKILSSLIFLLALAMPPLSAFAQDGDGDPNTVPEPGSLALLGMGAAVGGILWARNRKNKK